jgi:hypothetical protein
LHIQPHIFQQPQQGKTNMAKPYGNRNNHAMRNLRSAGSDAARFTAKTTGKAAVGLFRWASTDHSGMSRVRVQAGEPITPIHGFKFRLVDTIRSQDKRLPFGQAL